MKVVCSYCRSTLRDDGKGRSDLVSHGMCQACGEHFERLWAGMALGDYLDDLPGPAVLVDAEGRCLAANARAGGMTGREPSALRGLLGGEAMACAHSRLPEGCGKTVHCRECTIRRTCEEVTRTGKPVGPVQAFLKRDGETLPLTIRARPVGPLVELTIERRSVKP
jgi:PAS domain-containing protein